MKHFEAKYYTAEDGYVKCLLCPHSCVIKENKTGICSVRKNTNNKLYSENYGYLTAINFDPVEKKPLYHYYPGKLILSIGSFGCNMKCNCCQNWKISQMNKSDYSNVKYYSPEQITEIAVSEKNNIGIAYTYNEPIIWYEYMYDLAKLAHTKNLKNIVVSNGYINEKPLITLIPYIDGFNIDLKSFNNDFYRSHAKAELEAVKNCLKIIKKYNKHFEITYLLIPTLNDNENEFIEMIDWIVRELGEDTVLHLSRYFPNYKLSLNSTGENMIKKFYRLATEKLMFVYAGNIQIAGYQDTKCPRCKETVIFRRGYSINIGQIDNNGKCKKCQFQISNKISEE